MTFLSPTIQVRSSNIEHITCWKTAGDSVETASVLKSQGPRFDAVLRLLIARVTHFDKAPLGDKLPGICSHVLLLLSEGEIPCPSATKKG